MAINVLKTCIYGGFYEQNCTKRWYESKHIPVRFPFGHGLAYTTFAYEKLKVKTVGDHSVQLSKDWIP